MTVHETLLIFVSVLFLITQVFWFIVVDKLSSKLMARDYNEFKQYEVKKEKVKKQSLQEQKLDQEDERIVNEANKMFGMI